MDSLLQLIDNRIQKALSNSSCVNSQIGQVISVGENKCDVKLFMSGVTYSIPNFSGSDVYENQMVYRNARNGSVNMLMKLRWRSNLLKLILLQFHTI